uniref:Uncharacterized protein n=1 Tax=Arundo donax TaxID=35708 RepID=A0A0A9ARU8_ARUDO
MQPPNVGGA